MLTSCVLCDIHTEFFHAFEINVTLPRVTKLLQHPSNNIALTSFFTEIPIIKLKKFPSLPNPSCSCRKDRNKGINYAELLELWCHYYYHHHHHLLYSPGWALVCSMASVGTGGADKSLARPGMKKATATEDFDIHISYLLS